MRKNRSLLGGLGIIAAAVIVYFGFFYPRPGNNDLEGTIGTVTKHQSEQITGDDVVLAGEETSNPSDDPVVIEAMASILEQATVAQRSFAFLAVGRQDRAAMLLGASPDVRSAVLGKVTRDEQVAAFNRLDRAEKTALYGRMEVKEVDFGAMSPDRQAAALDKLGAKERAGIFGRVDPSAQLEGLARSDANVHAEILGRASRQQLARVYQAVPELNRVEMFNSLPLDARQSLMGKVYVNSSSALLQRATPVEVENLRNQMSDLHAADLFGASTVHDQLIWAGRAVLAAPASFETFGRAQKPEILAGLFLRAEPAQKAAFFRAQPAEIQNELLGKMSINREAWGGMDLNAQSRALASLSLERQSAMMARVGKAEVVELARQADPAVQKEFVGALSRVEMARALKLGASSREIHQALGRQPEIRSAVFAQSPADLQLRLMGRMVRSESALQ